MTLAKPTAWAALWSAFDALNGGKSDFRRGHSASGFASTVRPDVRAWFEWHDGQRSEPFPGAETYRMLSLREANGAYLFLTNGKQEVSQPYDPHWFPLLENAGGDYLVVDGKSGRLLEWQHDGKRRPVVAKSLLDWATQCLKRAKKVESPAGQQLSSDRLNSAKWKAFKFTRAHHEALPIGTLVWVVVPRGNPSNRLCEKMSKTQL